MDYDLSLVEDMEQGFEIINFVDNYVETKRNEKEN